MEKFEKKSDDLLSVECSVERAGNAYPREYAYRHNLILAAAGVCCTIYECFVNAEKWQTFQHCKSLNRRDFEGDIS